MLSATRFQFHKGAIRTIGYGRETEGLPFQFHKGAIRTLARRLFDNCESYFNSIKVRLEHAHGERGDGSNLSFQFHKGAIRTSPYPTVG